MAHDGAKEPPSWVGGLERKGISEVKQLLFDRKFEQQVAAGRAC